MINWDDFQKIQMAVGTITAAWPNSKARNPAYCLTIDFGELGEKQSSAQITGHYTSDALIGRQVIAVMNFPARHVAGFRSEVLVLAAMDDDHHAVLLSPGHALPNGAKIA